jgi:UDP-GlcNAc:undecaprenyl-phosphate GlcNAc-1-phosphate transferase
MESIIPLAPFVFGPFLVTALFMPLVKQLAWALDLVDHPAAAAHKSHEHTTPYGGAIAIALGLSIGLFLCVPSLLAELPFLLDRHDIPWLLSVSWLSQEFLRQSVLFTSLLGCGFALFLIGLVDDWRGLAPLPRFVAQLAIITFLVYAQPAFRLELLPGVPLVNAALTVLWIGTMTNAFNFLDNMDGLSAGIAAIVLVFLAFAALMAGESGAAVLCLSTFGALCGFLLFNLPPASIFMGDAGGLFLGFITSALSAYLSQIYGSTGLEPQLQWAPLLILAIPIYDFSSVNYLRIRSGHPPWLGDKNHISHRLVRLGFSRKNAVIFIYIATPLIALAPLIALHPARSTHWLWGAPVALALLAIVDAVVYRRPKD